VTVPPDLAARAKSRARAKAPDDDALPATDGFTKSAPKALRAIPPATQPPHRPDRAFEELFAAPKPAQTAGLHLSEEDLRLVEALRGSLEKGALILRALAELCLEKGLFTREEMRSRNQRR